MANTGDTRVDTKLFKNSADAMKTPVKGLSEKFNEWQRLANSIRGDWQGDVSDDVRNTAAQLKKSSEALVQSLGQYQKLLYEMAGIFDQTEKKTSEQNRSLSFKKGSMV